MTIPRLAIMEIIDPHELPDRSAELLTFSLGGRSAIDELGLETTLEVPRAGSLVAS